MAEESLLLRMKVEGGHLVAQEVDQAGHAVGRYERQASKAHDTTGRLGGAFEHMRSMAALALGATGLGGLAIGLHDVVSNAEALQEQQAQLSVATKAAHDHTRRATGAATDYADALALRGGFTTPEELQSMATFERITHNITKSEQEMSLATNIARGTHKDLSSATRAVMMAEAGRLTGLTRLGIILPKHATATQALAILQQRYAGTTAAYSHTAAGAMSNLGHMIEQLTAKIGGLIIPALADGVRWLSSFISQIEAGKGAGGVFRDVILTVWHAFTFLFGAIKDTVGALVSVVQGALQGKAGFQALAVFVGALIVGFTAWRLAILAQTAATSIAVAAQWAWNAALDANPIGLVVIAIAALVAGLVVAYTHVAWFRDLVNGTWSVIKTGVLDVIGFVSQHWQMIGSVLGGPFAAAAIFIITRFDSIKHTIGDVINWVIDRLNNIVDAYNATVGQLPFTPTLHHISHVGFGSATDAQNTAAGALGHSRGPGPSTGSHSHLGHQGRAYGGPVSYAGMFDVGEHGRETVHLPSGSYVDAHPGNHDSLVAAIREAFAQVGIYLDGRQVGRGLVRQGEMQAALR